MTPSDLIVLGVFLLILGLVIFYIVRAKKKGAACIGCPHAGSCAKKGSCSKK